MHVFIAVMNYKNTVPCAFFSGSPYMVKRDFPVLLWSCLYFVVEILKYKDF